jgi:hypothetical protein
MKASETWGQVVELSDQTGPIVFHFVPTKYMRVAPEHLKDWEEFTLKNAGHIPDATALKANLRVPWQPTATISGSNDGWDDSDWW